MKKIDLFETDDDDLESPNMPGIFTSNLKTKNLVDLVNEFNNNNDSEAPEKLKDKHVDQIIIEDYEDDAADQGFQKFRSIQVARTDDGPLGNVYCDFEDPSYCFHRWRMESNHSDDSVLWNLDPIVLRDERVILIPPSWPDFSEDIVEDEIGSFASWYANMIRRLSESRESIGEAMVATIDVSEAYSVQVHNNSNISDANFNVHLDR